MAVEKRAVFLDKDGTLVENVPYNVDPDRIRLMKGAAEGLRLFSAAGYHIVVVSNQAGIGKGMFDEAAMEVVDRRLRELLSECGAALAGFYWCPHAPPEDAEAACECRKPSPGMLFRAARDLGIALASSWMVGDILDDVEAGHRAGCTSILVDNGGETQWAMSAARTPDFVVGDLAQAAAVIAQEQSCRRTSHRSSIASRS